MAQPPHEAGNMPRGVSHTGGPANAIPDEEQPRFADSSAPLFNMYRKIAEEEDNKMAERWQKDADGILIFTGLFSAAVAALAAVTVIDLKPNSQDTSAFYLENIYQLLADPNISRSSIPVTPLRPPPFSPPKYVILVNSLWFLSLAISHGTVHTTLHESVHSLHMASINFGFLWWVAVTGAAYLLFTIMPILRQDAPYYSSLSSSASLARFVILYPCFLSFSIRHGPTNWKGVLRMNAGYFSRMFQGMEKWVERSARAWSPGMDGHILKWTFDAFTQDHDLDQFFNCILGFYHSKVVKDPRHSFARMRHWRFSWALWAYFDRTWALNDHFISESDKIRRIVTCVKVAETTFHVLDGWVVSHILDRDWHGQLSVEVGYSLRNRDNRSEQEIGLLAQTIVALIIADMQGSNRWIALATDQLGKSRGDILGYFAHGNDNVLLANLIHITRQILSPSSVVSQDMANKVADRFPLSLYSFEIRTTLLSLQHDFCALWNEIVPEAQNSWYFSTPACILRKICPLYIELHPGTDDARSSYPFCNNPDHRPGETAHTPDPILTTHLPQINSADTSPHPSDSDTPSRGHVANAPQLAIAPVSHTIPATSQHIVGASAAPLHESITTPPSMVPRSPSLASLIPTTSSVLTGDLHSPVDSSMNQSDRPPHGPASSSSSPTTDPSRIAPQAASFSDPSITIPGIQDANLPTLAGGDRGPLENLA
ncbi:hypothetical protein BJV78DRAFT_1351773 [Lactifluus subvellereus]|nr:hypothetical protein BJV78DRAFT_1351773 [Lactifluus subvellereus]